MDYLVYGIFNKKTGKIAYVGYTSKSLTERLKEHRADEKRKSKFEYLKNFDCDIKLLSACASKKLALDSETYYINYYKAPLNIQKVDKQTKVGNAKAKCLDIIKNLSKREEKFKEI